MFKGVNKTDTGNLYFCCGKCINGANNKHKIENCIKNYTNQICSITEDEIKHMIKVKEIGHFLHNYPAEIGDIENLNFRCSEGSPCIFFDDTLLECTKNDIKCMFYNGEQVCIKPFGNIDEI